MTNSSECTHESAVLGLLVFSSVTQGNMVASWDHLRPGAEELHHFQGGLLDPQQQQERTVACWQLHRGNWYRGLSQLLKAGAVFLPSGMLHVESNHFPIQNIIVLFYCFTKCDQRWVISADQHQLSGGGFASPYRPLTSRDLHRACSAAPAPPPSKHTPPQYPLSPPNMCEFIEFLE